MFCDTTYKEVVAHVSTRWLSLEQAVTRILELYASLSSYFLSIHEQQARFKRLHKRFSDPITEVYLLFLFLAPSQGKPNMLWLLAETPLILEPLLIYGMQMHHLQSIPGCEKVIGRPCVLPCNWMICINYYSLCSS